MVQLIRPGDMAPADFNVAAAATGGVTIRPEHKVPPGGASGEILASDGAGGRNWVPAPSGGGGADGVVTSGVLTGTDLVLNRSVGAPVTIDLAGLVPAADGVVTSASLTGSTLTLNRSVGAALTVDLAALLAVSSPNSTIAVTGGDSNQIDVHVDNMWDQVADATPIQISNSLDGTAQVLVELTDGAVRQVALSDLPGPAAPAIDINDLPIGTVVTAGTQHGVGFAPIPKGSTRTGDQLDYIAYNRGSTYADCAGAVVGTAAQTWTYLNGWTPSDGYVAGNWVRTA